MLNTFHEKSFPPINRAYNRVFQPGRLSLGLVVPLETYANSAIPTMERHLERAGLAEKLGYSALWLRDVPFNVPGFGDAGQVFDPFVYLGALAAFRTVPKSEYEPVLTSVRDRLRGLKAT